jgi:hypothetical protein
MVLHLNSHSLVVKFLHYILILQACLMHLYREYVFEGLFYFFFNGLYILSKLNLFVFVSKRSCL